MPDQVLGRPDTQGDPFPVIGAIAPDRGQHHLLAVGQDIDGVHPASSCWRQGSVSEGPARGRRPRPRAASWRRRDPCRHRTRSARPTTSSTSPRNGPPNRRRSMIDISWIRSLTGTTGVGALDGDESGPGLERLERTPDGQLAFRIQHHVEPAIESRAQQFQALAAPRPPVGAGRRSRSPRRGHPGAGCHRSCPRRPRPTASSGSRSAGGSG